MFKCFVFLSFLFFGCCCADVSSARDVLGQYSEYNGDVLEAYDQAVESWQGYCQEGWDMDRLLLAVEYAAKMHAGQVRKDASRTPYIVHPIGVANLLWEQGEVRSVNVLVAALLHDTLEDTDATEEEIEALFGYRVKETVREVTNDPGLSGEENKQRQVDHAPWMSLDAQLVKLADRVYNVRDLSPPPPAWSKEKVDGYYQWGQRLLAALKGTNRGLENTLQELIDTASREKP